jgi:hypothetical protein
MARNLGDQLRGQILLDERSLCSIATSSGLAVSVVTRFVNGERSLSLNSAEAIASTLGLRLAPTSQVKEGMGTAPMVSRVSTAD